MFIKLKSTACLFILSQVSLQAGPFTATGASTGKVIDFTYKKSIKPTAKQMIRFTRKSAKASEETTKNTHRYITKPTTEFTTKVSDNSTLYTKPSLDATTKKSIKPTAEFTTKISNNSTEQTKPSLDATTKVSNKTINYSIEVSNHSLKNTTKGTEKSSLYTKPLFKSTIKASKNSTVYTEPTLKATDKSSKQSSKLSAKTSKRTAIIIEQSSKGTTKIARYTGDFSKDSSKQMDLTIEQTTLNIWDDYQTLKVDPDIADQLIKDSYAFHGYILNIFANNLKIDTEILAQVIIKSLPKDATRGELENIMSYVVLELKDMYLENI